jgi:hypothetical protein
MTTEGFAVTNLTHDKTVGLRADSEPAWSPDGSRPEEQRVPPVVGVPRTPIVFVSDRTGATEIYTLTVPVLAATTPVPAMTQLPFDKAPKAKPGHGAHHVHRALELNPFGETTTQEGPLMRTLFLSVL